MKPNRIPDILDLSLAARQHGMIINGNFCGHAGLSKTEQVIQWVKKQRLSNPDFGFISLRCALLESPDFLGLPQQEVVDGAKVTTHYTPEFWPRDPDSVGVVFLDEWNRATTAVMNCLMSLTDSTRAVGPKYTLPKGWIVCGATNPESSDYDTNTADAALKDRFEHFEIEYDHNGFVDYMETNKWCEHIQMFVKSGAWIFKDPSSIGKDAKYISPRTFSKVNSAHKAGAIKDKMLHRIICQSILGKDIGSEFWKFIHSEAPITAQDIIKSKTKSLKKLKEQSDPNTYKGDFISLTVESITANYGGLKATESQIDEETMVEVASIIPSDMSVNLIRNCAMKDSSNISDYFKNLSTKYPKLVDILKANIKINKASTGTGSK